MVLNLLASAGGRTLAAVFGTVAAVRPTVKPLHPRGQVLTGTVTRHGAPSPTGVPWLDEPGEDQVLVRLSRATGIPEPGPDIHGIALRVPGPDGAGRDGAGPDEAGPAGAGRDGADGATPAVSDVLLATTGTGPLTRFLLVPGRSEHRAYTTLLPHRAPSGPLLLAALPRERPGHFDLALAHPRGPWTVFGELQVQAEHAAGTADPPLRFDPVLNPLPGLPPYPWVASLREGAYAAARRRSPSPRLVA